MKKLFALAFLASVISIAQAGALVDAQNKVATTFPLYSDANMSSHVVTQLAPQQLMTVWTPFYTKNGWVKLGNKADGSVGWVSQAQYQQMVQKNNISVSSTYVYAQNQDSQPAQILAYKNGQPLDPKAAQKLYQQSQKRWQQESQQWNQRMQFLQSQINRMQRQANSLWEQVQPVLMTMPPVLVVTQGVSSVPQQVVNKKPVVPTNSVTPSAVSNNKSK